MMRIFGWGKHNLRYPCPNLPHSPDFMDKEHWFCECGREYIYLLKTKEWLEFINVDENGDRIDF